MANGLATPEQVAMTPWQEMKDQAGMLVKTGFLPSSIKTPEQAVAIMLTGKELGVPPMQSLRGVNVIQGQPVVKPELMLALCVQRIKGFKYSFGECTNDKATFTASRPEMLEPYVSVFTFDDAKAAGLTGKDNWQKYRANMLRWRAVANALHIVAPDVLVGVYTPEEMGAVVDAEGGVVEAPEPTLRVTETEDVTEAEVVPEPESEAPKLATKKQLQTLGILCTEKIPADVDIHKSISALLKHKGLREDPIASRTELTEAQAEVVIEFLRAKPNVKKEAA